MPETLASYPCPVCSAQSPRLLYELNQFRIGRCASCGMVYVDPRVRTEDIFDIYRDEYFHRGTKSGYENYELNAPLRIKTFERWYSDLEPYLPDRMEAALDIGCAAGYFLDLLKQRGWPCVEGMELNRPMISDLRRRGFEIFDVPLEQFVPKRRYQLITLFDVLEHLPDINNDFEKLGAMLDDRGIVALVTPDFSSLQRKLFGRRWFQFKPREHIYYFTPQSLEKIAQNHGFSIVHLQRSGQFADFDFLQNRLARYRFPLLGKFFSLVCQVLRLKKKLWYVDTASIFVVLRKTQENRR
jgi:2-polyprenyl-3-methyl-5-hydroxy-6-metoxy-1,4-benzoquinol methylase